MAQDADLDLVLISPNQEPPVAKILDYGKYKYELAKKAKEAKKKQHVVEIKEVKMRYKIDTHDYEVRLKAARKFISQGNKVKGVVMLRGREMQHSNLAFDLAQKFITDMLEHSDMPVTLEKKPQLEGRNVTFFLVGQTSSQGFLTKGFEQIEQKMYSVTELITEQIYEYAAIANSGSWRAEQDIEPHCPELYKGNSQTK